MWPKRRYVGNMTDLPGDKSAPQRLFELAVYAPLGLALTIVEAVPALARKGRSRVAPQIGLARTVGQFAVKQSYRQIVGLTRNNPLFGSRTNPFQPGVSRTNASRTDPFRTTTSRTTTARATASRASTEPHAAADAASRTGVTPPHLDGAWHFRSPPASELLTPATPSHDASGTLAAAQLAIPSYDSLSAPQVVQRLAGLSREEIVAVRAYESATRGRRTILARADQLLA
jgi:hypothetical protein